MQSRPYIKVWCTFPAPFFGKRHPFSEENLDQSTINPISVQQEYRPEIALPQVKFIRESTNNYLKTQNIILFHTAICMFNTILYALTSVFLEMIFLCCTFVMLIEKDGGIRPCEVLATCAYKVLNSTGTEPLVPER